MIAGFSLVISLLIAVVVQSSPPFPSNIASSQGNSIGNHDQLNYFTVINLDRTETITITDVSIVGQTTGAIDTSYAFTATVAPISATIPITYVWRATNQTGVTHTAELTDAMTFIWNTTGTKTISVIASNEEGIVTGTYVVTITSHMIYLPLVMRRWPPIPYAPVISTVDNIDGDGEYTVIWAESPAQLADMYALQEATNIAFTTGIQDSCTVAQQFCNVNGKVAGTYYYRVRGHNSWGYGEWSNVQVVTVLPPGTPTLTAIENADGDGFYDITWTAAARATNYILEESVQPSFSNPATLYNGGGLSWSVANKDYGTYYYRVKAIGATGQSSWSNIQSATVPAPPPGVSVLNNHTIHSSSSYRYVVGEIYNNTSSYLNFVQNHRKFLQWQSAGCNQLHLYTFR